MRRAVLSFLVIAVVTVSQAAAIGLTVSNPNPQIGELVTFEITGYSGDVEAHWNFGGPGCAPFTQTYVCEPIYTDCLDASYRYSSAGAKTVTVQAYDPDSGVLIGSGMVNPTVQSSGSCAGSIQPVADMSIAPWPAFPGDAVMVTDTSTGTVETKTIWVTSSSNPLGSIICGDRVLTAGDPDTLECPIPVDLLAFEERYAHVAVANADFPCDPEGSCPGQQMAHEQIMIDRSPGAFITLIPPNPVTGGVVSLQGTGEGSPQGGPDAFEWRVTWMDGVPPVVTDYIGNPITGVIFNENGEWQIRLTVNYGHQVEPGGSDPDADGLYEARTWEVLDISSVAADFTILPASPLNTQAMTLDGSISNWTPGASLTWYWAVTGATTYGGCPNNILCTIPANTLNPGQHTITLILSNSNGDVSTKTKTVNVGDGTCPELVVTMETSTGNRAVAVSGRYAFLAGDDGLRVVDVSAPSAPFVVGSVALDGAHDVAVLGDYAYVAGAVDIDHLGLIVVNIATPTAPVAVGFCSSGVAAYGVAVSGNYAYLATDAGLQVFDVSTPSAPFYVAAIPPGGIHTSVAISNGYAYDIDTLGDVLYVVDISNPTVPDVVATVSLPGARGVDVSGNHAYVASLGHLWIVDIATPAAPVVVGSFDASGMEAYNVAVSSIYAYVADISGRLLVIDVGTPSAPVEVGSADTLGGAWDAEVSGGYTYVALGAAYLLNVNGLAVFGGCEFSDGFESGDTSAWSMTVP